MKTMGNGYYEDILSWINSESVKDKLFRVWFLDDLDINDLCIYEYFTQMICLPDGDVLIGMQEYDRKKENCRSEIIEYHRLSEISFCYDPADQD